MIIKETLELVKERIGGLEVRVEGVAVGLFYAGVATRSSRGIHGGVAYVLRNSPSCSPIESAGSLHEMDPLTLARLSLSPNPVEASVGVAALNALSQTVLEGDPSYKPVNVDVTDMVKEGESVAMVGYMEPVLRRLLKKNCKVFVSEIVAVDNPIVPTLPPNEAERYLTTADVVIVTGSTLVNKTIDEILGLDLKARMIAVAGPTASMLPDVLFDYGVTALMGVAITNSEEMLRVVIQGGGTRQLLSACAQKKAYFAQSKR
ncbi:MAG: hypothetical protein KIH01_04525 [Candidatus Freyarchaeota archaeon]|nr:hypothetical protein [Candidatus Jordarchaeia archaeon]